ncbi:MAG: nicotinate-nucleotide adenylyltransferase [Chloroflexi bacterium]|nr:nicotinate-nucleotide adenylyltransferase [Chloroflexota bacterium]
MAPRSGTETRAAGARRSERAGRIGVFGGTFDPPHVGHLWLAAMAADAVGLDRVLFMPAAQPPHKGERLVTRAADRLLMTRLAIDGDPAFELSGLEMERPGPSYTIDSIVDLKRLHPDDELLLVMAADSLEQIDTWREPDRLLDEVRWIVGPRPGTKPPDPARLAERFGERASRIELLNGPALDVSASEIRRRVAAGETIRYLVPRDVEEMIIERGMYRRG